MDFGDAPDPRYPTLLASDGARHSYEVLSSAIVDARKGGLVLDTDAAMLTLVTCYPFGAVSPGGPLRYIVTAKKVP